MTIVVLIGDAAEAPNDAFRSAVAPASFFAVEWLIYRSLRRLVDIN